MMEYGHGTFILSTEKSGLRVGTARCLLWAFALALVWTWLGKRPLYLHLGNFSSFAGRASSSPVSPVSTNTAPTQSCDLENLAHWGLNCWGVLGTLVTSARLRQCHRLCTEPCGPQCRPAHWRCLSRVNPYRFSGDKGLSQHRADRRQLSVLFAHEDSRA